MKYGRGEVAARLDPDWRIRVISPTPSETASRVEDLLVTAMDQPIGSATLSELAVGARRVVVTIPDATRPLVAQKVLPGVLDRLAASGVGLNKISIFVASGAHAGSSEEDLRRLVGDSIPAEITVDQNYARRAADFRLVGITRRGTPIMLNNLLLDADLNIAIGAVGFHYFAGMSGGRKLIVPGACHVETIRANHRLTIAEDGSLNPMCASGILDGNPIHEDLVEGMGYIPNIFMINLVLDGWAEARDVTCGHPVASHLEAVKRAKRLLEIPLSERCDLALVSAGGHPLDVNFIQAHKSIDHAAEAVRDAGVLVAATECADGIGSDSFLPWFSLGNPKAIAKKLRRQYELNGQTAVALMRKLERIKIILVSSLERQVVETMGMAAAGSLDEALTLAQAIVGKSPLTYVFPIAWGILPIIEG